MWSGERERGREGGGGREEERRGERERESNENENEILWAESGLRVSGAALILLEQLVFLW